MTGGDAFEERMDYQGITDGDAETAAFLQALRVAVPIRPAATAEPEMIRRLAETARLASLEVERSTTGAEGNRARSPFGPLSRLPSVARAAVAVALIPALTAGLAFAGVTLPDPARSAFESVGVDLPNQPATESDRDAGESATEETGTGKGTTSGKGNSDAAHRHAIEQRSKAQGKALGHTRGKAIGLYGKEPPGHTREAGPPEQSNAGSAKKESAPAPDKPIKPVAPQGLDKRLTD